jgi:hypothetical protein
MGMSSLPSLPNLHDGYFDGVWVSDKKSARLFVRTVDGDRFTILLTGVVALTIDGLKQGNIIFDVVLAPPNALTIEKIKHAHGSAYTRDGEMPRLLEQAQQQSLCTLEMSTSYGAEGAALFHLAELIPGHVLE